MTNLPEIPAPASVIARKICLFRVRHSSFSCRTIRLVDEKLLERRSTANIYGMLIFTELDGEHKAFNTSARTQPCAPAHGDSSE